MLITSNYSFQNLTLANPSSTFNLKFSKNFVGEWPSSLIAVDSILQTAIIGFIINVLKWPQSYCLYWDSSGTFDWTQWISGYVIDGVNRKWVPEAIYYDGWIIMAFAILIILLTIFTDHDLNASNILLESITIYWMLFMCFKNKAINIKQYYERI